MTSSNGHANAHMRKPNLTLIQLAKVVYDEEVNRKQRQWHVDRLIADWDWRKFGVPVVSQRSDGTYVPCEGAHRLMALTATGYEVAWVDVYEDQSLAEEADLFIGHNNKLTVVAVEKFQKQVVASHQPQSAINIIVTDHGLTVASSQSNGHITAVGSLETIYEQGGAKLLRRTLAVVLGAWGPTADAVQGWVLKGVASVLAQHGEEVDTDVLVSTLAKVPGGGGGVIAQAKARRAAMGKTLAENIYAVITGIYNKGRRKADQLQLVKARPDAS